MIILHNSLDKKSREFVAQYGEGQTVIDWYQDQAARDSYLAQGLPSPSSFPSLVDEERRLIYREPSTIDALQAAVDGYAATNGEDPPPGTSF